MKIAVGSDMKTHLTDYVVELLNQMGHTVAVFGALAGGEPPMWSKAALEVAEKVGRQEFEQAVLFCWTGTGISLAANKVRGIRAALCHDAETARGARLWNDANILAMSIRSTSEPVAREILDAWFATAPSADAADIACLAFLAAAEAQM